ncbi:GAF domain-containing protein [Undibacterium seohonense]|uniref:histidine kinase n=1 Tax=Undibacterium seohonense TaxID=1344950 RepID=A0ABR6X0N0_9BURK|nr:GAF domain-containing protein [Undibacterium seohonense]
MQSHNHRRYQANQLSIKLLFPPWFSKLKKQQNRHFVDDSALTAYRWILILCLSIICLLTTSATAQTTNAAADQRSQDPTDFSFAHRVFERVGNEDSLPINVVTAIAQDKRGLMWVGTQAGLVSYDGYRFQKYTHFNRDQSSLSGDNIKSLWAAPNGELWVGTISGGISIFDPDSGKFRQLLYGPNLSTKLEIGAIQAIKGDQQGGVWIVGTETGLHHLSADRKSLHHYRHQDKDPGSLLDDRVRSIMLDRQGTLWVGTVSGLQKRSSKALDFESIGSDAVRKEILAGQEVRSLYEADDGKIWLGFAKNGAAWIDPQSGKIQLVKLDTLGVNKLGDNVVDIITQVRPEEIWVSRYGYGIYVLDATTGKILQRIRNDPALPGSLAFDQIGSMFKDQSGILWIGSWGGGLQRYSGKQEAIRMLRHSSNQANGLSRANIRSLLETQDGRLLFGTDGNGIDVFDRKRGLISGYRNQAQQADSSVALAVLALAESADQTIWAGTRQSGLQSLQKHSQQWKTYTVSSGLPSNQIRSLYVSRRNDLWVGTTLGLAKWQAAQKRFMTFSSKQAVAMNSYVTAFAEQTDGKLWIGSESGLWLYDPVNESLQQFQHDAKDIHSLSSNEVNGLLIDRSGQLWVDTAQGLDRLISWDESGAKFVHVSADLGRAGLYFGANLFEDQHGRIWTQWFVYDPKLNQLIELSKVYGIDLGTAWVGAHLKTKSGHFLYGGTKGIAIVDPERFERWKHEPLVLATGLKIDGSEQFLNLREGITLHPRQRNFEVEYTTLDYLAPDKNRYAYRLLGYQDAWIESDAMHRTVSYGNLWPGDYQLQLKGGNASGDWTREALTIPVRVLPAFWQTNWFFALVFLTLSGSIYSVYRWRMARVKAEKRSLQDMVAARTADILNLGEIGQSLTATLDIEQAFERIHKQVITRVDAQVFGIGFFDQTTQMIEVDYMVEDGVRQGQFHYTLEEKERPAVWCVIHQQELITNNLTEVLNYVQSIAPVRSGKATESIVYIPLFVEKEVVGCMTAQSTNKNAYSPDQLEFLRAIANYVAIAIANSNFHRHLIEAQKQLAQQEKMASLGQLVANVAHEINTPIGAIKSSGDNISNALNTAMSNLSQLMHLLDQDTRELFLQLINEIKLSTSFLNTREERKLVKDCANQLEQLGIPDSRRKAGILVQLRVHQQLSTFLPLLQHHKSEQILHAANEIGAIINSAQNIHVAVDRVSKIVFAFKSFSRIGTNHEKTQVDLREGMETVLTLYQSKINKGTELICQFDDIPAIACWPDELVQVWVNLIHNALQAMNYSGTLTIRIQKIDNEAVVSVSDTGTGIPVAIRDKIFEVFFTTKGIGEGSGLGLDIVKKVINKHHGRITFETEVNKGTTFFVHLPYSP